MPSRRHCRQTGPMYRAKFDSYYLSSTQVRFTALAGLRPALDRSLYGSVHRAGTKGSGQNYTRRFFGGRHPLCGIGVTSLIARTSIPAVDNARTADSRPEPGPLTRTSTTRNPVSDALLAAVMEACCAANGVPLRDPRKPSDPALDQATVLPS